MSQRRPQTGPAWHPTVRRIPPRFPPTNNAHFSSFSTRFSASPPRYAHNVQQDHAATVHAQTNGNTKGELGRIVDTLNQQGSEPFSSRSYSINGVARYLDGKHSQTILSRSGVKRFVPYAAKFRDSIDAMSKNISGSIFAETFNGILDDALAKTESLGAILESSAFSPNTEFSNSGLEKQLKQVTKIIKARKTIGSERDVFFVNIGGFDTHSNMKTTLRTKFKEIDDALGKFETEMADQKLWDSVALLSASDFGRTLVTNGAGTDHAWAGHNFMVGGAVKGRKILGSYPASLADDAPLSVRTGGRFIPTTSWEAVWHGIASWFGVEDGNMAKVLPGMDLFPKEDMLTREAMFE